MILPVSIPVGPFDFTKNSMVVNRVRSLGRRHSHIDFFRRTRIVCLGREIIVQTAIFHGDINVAPPQFTGRRAEIKIARRTIGVVQRNVRQEFWQ